MAVSREAGPKGPRRTTLYAPKHSMSWPDWTNVSSGVAQALIAILGFGLAIYELRRARRAAEGTRALVLMQNMRNAERELDNSLPRKNAQAVRALNDWRSLCSEAHGVLKRMEASNALLNNVEKSRQAAAEAKGEILGGSKETLATITQKARVLIAEVCDDVSQFIGGVG